MFKTNNQILILSIETSGAACSAALSIGESLIGEYSSYSGNNHDRLLAEFIRRLLNDGDYKTEELDAVAVSAGPGSFTGLRIGASIAKGLCYENKPLLIAVPTLTAIAHSSMEAAKLLSALEIIPVVPSHKDIIYYQRFNTDIEEISPIINCTIDDLNELDHSDSIICGPASNFIKGGIKLQTTNNLNAGIIANIAIKYYQQQKFTEPEEFIPLYVQEFLPKAKINK